MNSGQYSITKLARRASRSEVLIQNQTGPKGQKVETKLGRVQLMSINKLARRATKSGLNWPEGQEVRTNLARRASTLATNSL